LVERNRKKIEDEQCKDLPAVMGKVTGSSPDFPYTMQRFTVQMSEPSEVNKSNKRILRWQQEIEQAEKEMEAVETFIAGIPDVGVKEIFTYRYIDNMKVEDVANKIGYTKGRISQIISNFVKD
jgi:plasmid maintenance system antidote protein VapI